MNPENNKFTPLYSKVEDLNGGESSYHKAINKLCRESETILDFVQPDGTPVPKNWSIFTVGEEIVIKNYTFKVAHIGESYIVFEPVGPVIIKKDE